MNTEQELARQVATLNAELVQRATPRAAELMDSLNNLMGLARAGQPGAREVLRDFTATLDEARAMASGIQVARGGPNGV